MIAALRRIAPRSALGALLLAGCQPDLGDRASLITGPRVLAVRGSPPEAAPGAEVAFDILVASPEGTLSPAASWAFCASAPPLASNGPVSDDCLDDTAVRPIAAAAEAVTAKIPSDACALFGPDVPPGGLRPRDADITGGYYQPVRVRAEGETAFGMERISCALADAPVDAVKELASRYKANQNPTITSLTAGAGQGLATLHPGEAVTLTLTWNDGDAEAYPVFDRESQTVVDRREGLRVSFYVTAGALASDRTGIDENSEATSTENVWTAPDEAGPVFLWAVLRDSRGGADHIATSLNVVP